EPCPPARCWMSNDTPSKNAARSSSAYGVPIRNPIIVATRNAADGIQIRHHRDSATARGTSSACATAIDAASAAALYFAEAANPAISPAAANRSSTLERGREASAA